MFLAAIFLSILRVLTPMAPEYREDIESFLTALLDQPVSVKTVEARWKGLGPILILGNVQLLGKDGKVALVHFDEAQIGISALESIKEGKLVPGSFKVIGADLSIRRYKDGHIRVKGFSASSIEPGSEQEDVFSQWLFSQRELGLENSRIDWRDDKIGAKPLHFTNINLHLNNNGDQHTLKGDVKLPATLGQYFSFHLDFKGDLRSPEAWAGEMAATGESIHIAQLLGSKKVLGFGADGIVDFKVDTSWSKGRMDELEGTIGLTDFKLSSIKIKKSVVYDRIASDVVWERGWDISLRNLEVVRGSSVWPKTFLHFTSSDNESTFNMNAGFIRAEDITDLLLISNQLEKDDRISLESLNPTGDLTSINMSYSHKSDGQAKYSVNTNFSNVSISEWKQFPAVNGLSGSFRADNETGNLTLTTQELEIASSGMFREPVMLNTFTGKIDWKNEDSKWHVKVSDLDVRNDDISAHMNMEYDIPGKGKSPYIKLTGTFSSDKGENVQRYYPANLMSKKLLAWSDQAFVKAKITKGSILVDGPLQAFPFDKKEGTFEVHFDAVDTTLSYAEDWPVMEHLNASVAFYGRRMEIEGSTSRVLSTEVYDVHAVIPNVSAEEEILYVKGKTRGPTSDGLEIVARSPLRQDLGKYMSGMTATGSSTADIDLIIPLVVTPNTVKGTIQLKDSSIKMVDSDITFDQVNGSLQLTEDKILADGLKSRLFDRDAIIRIGTELSKTDKGKSEQAVVVDVQTTSNVKRYAELFKHPIFSYMQGESPVHARLVVPPTDDEDDVKAVLNVDTNLKGIAITLPAPLNKKADTSKKLYLSMNLVPETVTDDGIPERKLRLAYGKDINGLFVIQNKPEGIEFDRGEIGFGSKIADVDHEGMRITGKLAKFSLDTWYEFESKTAAKTEGKSDENLLGSLNSVDIKIDELVFMERTFKSIHLKMARQEKQWMANIVNEMVNGNIIVPDDLSTFPVVMNLESLHIPKIESDDDKSTERIDPRELPALKITSKQFIYGDMDLGQLSLETSKNVNGLRIDKLILHYPTSDIIAHGAWSQEKGQQKTHLDIKVTSKDVGDLLKRFGFADNIDDGETDSEFNIHWPGAPMDFSLAETDGNVKISVKEGRILDVNPGATGRVFGLFSLQALPRRLSLDFNDLFGKGFYFDDIEGQFDIDKGNAYTNDLVVDGPSARIDIWGWTDLSNKDYNQNVTVTPKISAGLSVAGFFGGPAVGAAVFAIEKVLGPTINEMTRYHYTVTGTWDKPTIEPIKSEDLIAVPDGPDA